MTHFFLLPVGGAILWLLIVTLCARHHTTNKTLKFDQNQTMYVDVIRRFLSLIFHHKFIASPRANRSRYQKSPGNFASPMSWDHVHRVWWQSGGKLQRSISNSRAWFFKQPWIADFLLGGAYDMQCEICSAQWDLYVYRVLYEYVQACVSYTSSFQTVF